MNPLANFHAKVATWPLWGQTIYYSLESATIAALVLFFTGLQGAISSKGGIANFDWVQQVHDVILAVEIGAVKGVIDLLKAVGTPKAP